MLGELAEVGGTGAESSAVLAVVLCVTPSLVVCEKNQYVGRRFGNCKQNQGSYQKTNGTHVHIQMLMLCKLPVPRSG